MNPIKWKTGDPIGMDHIAFVSNLEQKVGMLEDESWSVHEIRSLIRDMKEEMDR